MNGAFEGLGLVDLIDLLEPVPEPPPISWAPQTIGWLWLGLAVLAIVLWTVCAVYARRRARAYRRAALTELDAAGEAPEEIAAILRRVALCAYPRAKVASLTGPDWVAFLDASFPGSGFTSGVGAVLADAPYRGGDPAPGLNTLARDWVRTHKAEAAL
ncbi:MAG: DUF4381 domain-containing protein [Pseudomonadota bacterium]